MMKRSSKKFLCLILALGMACNVSSPLVVQAAKKKPKLNKKKLTLTVGQTAKLKVKNTKKKIKWSSSKKSVATITKKGKVKAKKAGKTTIIAKFGKKKLKCKVTVKAKKGAVTKTPQPTKKPGTTTGGEITVANIISALHIKDYNEMTVTLTSEQKLGKGDFTIHTKKWKSSSFEYALAIDRISTVDNVTYTLYLRDSHRFVLGEFVQVTVKDKKGIEHRKETKYVNQEAYESQQVLCRLKDKEVDVKIPLDGFGYHEITSIDLPKGLRYTTYPEETGNFFYVKISGKPEETGVFEKKIVSVDELGNTCTKTIKWLIGSATDLVATCEPGYFVYKNSIYAEGGFPFYVSGGSGEYTYQTSDSSVYITEQTKTVGKNISSTDVGTSEIEIEVTDANDETIKTTFTWEIHVAQAREVATMIRDAKGNYISGEVATVKRSRKTDKTPFDDCLRDTWTTSIGQNSIWWTLDGVYDLVVNIDGYEYTMDNFEVKEDRELEWKLPLYEVTVKEGAEDLSGIIWRDAFGTERGKGENFYAAEGTYQYYGVTQKDLTLSYYEIAGNVSATEENTVTPAKTKTERAVLGDILLNQAVPVKVEDSYYRYYRFVPEESGTYQFYSETVNEHSGIYVDPAGKLYDGEGTLLQKVDDGTDYSADDWYHFVITQECVAGETYYIGVTAENKIYNGKEVNLIVEKTE